VVVLATGDATILRGGRGALQVWVGLLGCITGVALVNGALRCRVLDLLIRSVYVAITRVGVSETAGRASKASNEVDPEPTHR
jgi:hypothetical protein